MTDAERQRLVSTGVPVLVTIVVISTISLVLLWVENGPVFVDLGWSSFVVLMVWTLYAAIAVGWVVRAQRYGRRPRRYVIAAFAWGGLAAGAIAQQANTAVAVILGEVAPGIDSSWTLVPVVEETLKMLAVVALATIPQAWLRTTLDGLFYGVMAGSGFLVVENVIYTVGAVDESTSLGFTIFGMLVIRGVIGGVLSHVVYTGLIGAGIGYFVSHRRRDPARSFFVVVGAVAVAMGTHAVHNTRDGLTAVTFTASLVPLVALVVILRSARTSERERLIGVATTGVSTPLIDADDLTDLLADPDAERSVLTYVHSVEIHGSDSDEARRAASRVAGHRK